VGKAVCGFAKKVTGTIAGAFGAKRSADPAPEEERAEAREVTPKCLTKSLWGNSSNT
jgi:hypothetical protein